MWIQIWILSIDFCPRSLRIIISLDDQFSLVAEGGHPQLPHQVLVSQVPGGENTNQRVANNQRATNLYASTKFPCTRSPNSRFSASSWKKSGLRGTTFWLIYLFAAKLTMFWSTVPLTGMPGTVAQSHGGLISFEQTRTIENLNYFYPKEKPTQPQELMVFPKLISPPPWQPGNYHSPKDFHLD